MDVEGAVGRKGEGPAWEDEAVGGKRTMGVGAEGFPAQYGLLVVEKGGWLEDGEAEVFRRGF